MNREIVWINLIVLFLIAHPVARAQPENPFKRPVSQDKAGEQSEDISKSVFNFIAVETGTIRDGEQIPLPKYGDGTYAKREECKYMVSPSELTTSLSTATIYRGQSFGGSTAQSFEAPKESASLSDVIKSVTSLGTATQSIDTGLSSVSSGVSGQVFSQQGIYYIKCSVDQKGFVKIGLWKQRYGANDLNIAEDKTYDQLQQYYREQGITSAAGEEDQHLKKLQELRSRVVANYMVIALRKPKKS